VTLGKWLVAVALGLCWLGSIGLPAVETVASTGPATMMGYEILWMGWFAVFMLQFGWFANIVLPVVLLLALFAGQSRLVHVASIWLALLLLALTLNAAMWREIPTDFRSIQVVGFRIGYWLWMGAMLGGSALVLVPALIAKLRR
jgi:hypothetical protein